MKKHCTLFGAALLLASAALLPQSAAAQRLKIHCGAVTYVTSATAAGQVTFSADGSQLQLPETSLEAAAVDSITVDRADYNPLAVGVVYSNGGAALTVPCYLADNLTISVDGGHVSIVQSADLQEEVVYALTGSSTDGSFFMDGEYKAGVVLDNLSLSNPSGAAIDIENGKRIDINLPAGTTTTLSDGTGGLQKACFFVNGHAEFAGGGTINVVGNTKHAYASDEYTQFKADFGTFNVTSAVSDGIHVEQYLHVLGGAFHVSGVGGDCVDVSITKDPTDVQNGQILIEGGTFDIAVTADDVKGLKCDSAMTVTGGTIKAQVSGLGTKGISTGTDLLIAQTGETPTLIDMQVTGTTYMPGDATLESKCRGIKVKGNFTFDGGTIKISATGAKSKAISVDGSYTYKSGSINCAVDAAN